MLFNINDIYIDRWEAVECCIERENLGFPVSFILGYFGDKRITSMKKALKEINEGANCNSGVTEDDIKTSLKYLIETEYLIVTK